MKLKQGRKKLEQDFSFFSPAPNNTDTEAQETSSNLFHVQYYEQ